MIACALLFSLLACGSGNSPSSEQPSANNTGTPLEQVGISESTGSDRSEANDAKALIAYFSRSGNTREVATEIQKQTNGEIFEIIPEKPYTEDYDTMLEIGKEEQQKKTRPAISGAIDDLENYNVIFLGYPIWWGDMPMILYTFLDSYDLSGKTIIPFCTSGNSGLSRTLDSIQGLEPDATVLNGLHIGNSSAADPGEAVREWLSGLASGMAE